MCNFKRSNLITCLMATAFISILQILGRFLDVRSGDVSISLKTNILEGLLFFVLCFASIICFWKFGKKILATKPLTNRFFFKSWFWQSVILISWLPCFLAYFPGIYSYDGEPQLIQYTTGKLDNHHPILHTLILGECYDLGQWFKANGINIDGLAFYTVIQVLLLSFALAYVLEFLVNKKVGSIFVILSAMYICLFPTMPLMAISSTKDTFYTAFFILFITKFLRITETQRKSEYISLFIFSAGCMFFRRNGYYVITIFVLCMAVLCIIKKKKISRYLVNVTIVLVISVFFFTITEKAIISFTGAARGESAEALSIPLQQMARAFKNDDNAIRVKYGERLTSYVSETGLCNYRPLITDGVKQYFNNEHFAEDKAGFIKVYLELGKEYPGPYALAVLYLTKGDWDIMDTSYCKVYKDWWRDRTGYLITDATPVFAGAFVTKSDLLPSVRSFYERFATECSFMRFIPFKIMCAPAFYVFLSILGAIVLVMEKKRRFYPVAIVMILYLLTVLAGPCVLIRYIFPLMAVMPLFAWCVLQDELVL